MVVRPDPTFKSQYPQYHFVFTLFYTANHKPHKYNKYMDTLALRLL